MNNPTSSKVLSISALLLLAVALATGASLSLTTLIQAGVLTTAALVVAAAYWIWQEN